MGLFRIWTVSFLLIPFTWPIAGHLKGATAVWPRAYFCTHVDLGDIHPPHIRPTPQRACGPRLLVCPANPTTHPAPASPSRPTRKARARSTPCPPTTAAAPNARRRAIAAPTTSFSSTETRLSPLPLPNHQPPLPSPSLGPVRQAASRAGRGRPCRLVARHLGQPRRFGPGAVLARLSSAHPLRARLGAATADWPTPPTRARPLPPW
jgi:hypothetical protein